MRASLRSIMLSLLAMLAAVVAHAETPGCGALEFSKEVLARFPNAPRACLDVVMREGEPYGVFKANIVRTYDAGNAIDLRFKLPDGSMSDTRKLKTNPALRVRVQGKETSVSQLVVGDELTAYVKVRAPELALIPAEPEAEPQFVEIPPAAPAEQQMAAAAEPAMPHTAGYTSTLLLIAGVVLAIATALFMYRAHRGDR